MVFKRRKKMHWVETLRSYVLPRSGWKRTLIYLSHRLQRLPDSPTRIARGLAFGVFASFSPFFGFHIILAMLMAKMLRANLIAAVAGTLIGNPISFPFIIGFALNLGNWLLGRDLKEHDLRNVGRAFREAFRAVWHAFKAIFGAQPKSTDGLGDFFSEIMLPYLIGGLLLGLVFGAVTFYISKPLIIAYQAHRRKRLAKKKNKETPDS